MLIVREIRRPQKRSDDEARSSIHTSCFWISYLPASPPPRSAPGNHQSALGFCEFTCSGHFRSTGSYTPWPFMWPLSLCIGIGFSRFVHLVVCVSASLLFTAESQHWSHWICALLPAFGYGSLAFRMSFSEPSDVS